MPESTTPPLRGRRGRDRRIAEEVARDFAARHAPPADDDVVDFDIGAVDAEVDDARRAEAGDGAQSRKTKRPARPATPERHTGAGHRLPDLATLPPLLAATGTFGSLRERLGSPADIGRVGRHAGLVDKIILHRLRSAFRQFVVIGTCPFPVRVPFDQEGLLIGELMVERVPQIS